LSTFLHFLQKNPWIHFLVLLTYCLAVILPHETVGAFLMGFLDKMPRSEMTRIVLSVGLVLVGVLSIPFWVQWTKHPSRNQVILFLILAVALVVLTFKYLFVLATEVAHFPQYALMAILLFPLTWRMDATMIWATLIGVIDEAYQYYYLTPDSTNYYDFNDVFTDLLGAILGLIFLWGLLRNEIKAPRSLFSSPSWMAMGGFVLLTLALYWFAGDTVASIVRTPEEAFWTVLPRGISFHVLRPIPGLVLILLTILVFRQMGKPWNLDEP